MSTLRSWESILWSSSPYGHKPPQRAPAASRAPPGEGADPSFQPSRTSLLSRALSGFLFKRCTAEPHMQIVAGNPHARRKSSGRACLYLLAMSCRTIVEEFQLRRLLDRALG